MVAENKKQNYVIIRCRVKSNKHDLKNQANMDRLEGITNEVGSSTLLEKANACTEMSAEQLDTPIENKTIESSGGTSGLQGLEVKNEDLLNTPIEQNGIKETSDLSIEDKVLLREETGWSDEIVDHIKSPEEANVYKKANLKDVNGNLERTDIDWNAKIPQDRIDRMRSLYSDEVADRWSEKTNMNLIKDGKAPYGPDGERVNLHHIGQKAESPLAELTDTEHKLNDAILHDKTKESEIERSVFRKERESYWRHRYEELNNE